MQTKQIIQSSANVIRITNITKGNIYKRFDKSYDYTYYGIVNNVYNDGNNTFIEVTEYRKSYSDMSAENKILKGDEDYMIFPTTIEEIQNEFESVINSKEKDNESCLKKIVDNNKIIELTKKLISGEMQKELTEVSFKEISQLEFNERKAVIAELN